MFDLRGAALPFDDQNAAGWARQVAATREWEYRHTDPALLHRFRRVLGAPDQPRHPGNAFLSGLNPLADLKREFLSHHSRPTDGNSSGHKVEHVLVGRHRGRPCVAFQYGWSTATDGNDRTGLGSTWSGAAIHLGYRTPDLTVLPTRDSWTLAPPPGAPTPVGHPAVDAHYRVTATSPAFAVDVLRSPLGDFLAHRLIGFHLTDESAVVVTPGYLHRFPLDQVLDDLSDIADRVPEEVVSRLRGGPA